MKTQLIILAAILISSLSLSAKETKTVTPDEVAVSEMSQSTYESEEALAIESWMTNDYEWNLTSANEVTEEPLQIEGWMTNSELWNQNSTNSEFSLDNVNEEPLTIENWMTNDASWMM